MTKTKCGAEFFLIRYQKQGLNVILLCTAVHTLTSSYIYMPQTTTNAKQLCFTSRVRAGDWETLHGFTFTTLFEIIQEGRLLQCNSKLQILHQVFTVTEK